MALAKREIFHSLAKAIIFSVKFAINVRRKQCQKYGLEGYFTR